MRSGVLGGMRQHAILSLLRLGVVVGLGVGAGCAAADAASTTSSDTSAADTSSADTSSSGSESVMEASERTSPVAAEPSLEGSLSGSMPDVALVSADGRVAVLRNGAMTEPVTGIIAGDDETLVATTLERSASGEPSTTLTWTNLADGTPIGRVTLSGDLRAVATDRSGRFVALINEIAGDFADGIAAQSKPIGTEIVIADAEGERFRQRYDTEIVPEGFSNISGDNGLPIGLFVQEFLDPPMTDAEAPRWYQVRVLDTSTGDLQLPFNLRDKATLVDEQMLGFGRSNVLSLRNGLLFTLYRGVGDDSSDYAFVHTLGFASGVWCLELPDQLSLEWELGTLGLVEGESKLLVVSANGFISEFVVADITDTGGPETGGTESVPTARRTVRSWQADTASGGPSVATAPGVVVVGQATTLRWIDPVSLVETKSLSIGIEIDSLAAIESGAAVVAGADRLARISPTGELVAEMSLGGFGAVSRILLL